MKSSFLKLRERVQAPQNTKQISNYIYYPDFVLGKGNYSTVYEAISKKTKQKIAAKIIDLSLYSNPKMVELLDQQIRTLLTLDHPNIIKCYDILKTSQYCYCFTQLCEGGCLAEKLIENGPMTQDQAWPYIRDVYEALNYLHSQNIIHRDIKAANIFLKEGKAKLADFGFAVHSKVPFKDLSIGSPVYMTPEGFIDGLYTMKTDVWSFGILIFELLHGYTPFSNIEDPQILTQAMKRQIQQESFKPSLSSEVKKLMRCCLEIDESKRISMPEIQFSDFMQKYIQKQKNIPIKVPLKPYQYKTKEYIQRNKSHVNINLYKPKKVTPNQNNPQKYVYEYSERPQISKPITTPSTNYIPYNQYSNYRVIRLQSTLKVHDQTQELVSPTYHKTVYYQAKMNGQNQTTVIHPIQIK